jgi:hypothetical protein
MKVGVDGYVRTVYTHTMSISRTFILLGWCGLAVVYTNTTYGTRDGNLCDPIKTLSPGPYVDRGQGLYWRPHWLVCLLLSRRVFVKCRSLLRLEHNERMCILRMVRGRCKRERGSPICIFMPTGWVNCTCTLYRLSACRVFAVWHIVLCESNFEIINKFMIDHQCAPLVARRTRPVATHIVSTCQAYVCLHFDTRLIEIQDEALMNHH